MAGWVGLNPSRPGSVPVVVIRSLQSASLHFPALAFAHRAFCAAAIRARPAALILRLLPPPLIPPCPRFVGAVLVGAPPMTTQTASVSRSSRFDSRNASNPAKSSMKHSSLRIQSSLQSFRLLLICRISVYRRAKFFYQLMILNRIAANPPPQEFLDRTLPPCADPRTEVMNLVKKYLTKPHSQLRIERSR
jgi:hypothetical protein